MPPNVIMHQSTFGYNSTLHHIVSQIDDNPPVGTDMQIPNDCSVFPQFVGNGYFLPHEQMMRNGPVLRDLQDTNQNAQLSYNTRNTTEPGSPEYTCQPLPITESHTITENQQPVMQQIAPKGNNPVLNEETLLNIIKSIKNLESLLRHDKFHSNICRV